MGGSRGKMILVALGSNRTGSWGNPRQTVRRALAHLDQGGLRLVAASRLLVTQPFGRANQPPFVNAVAVIATGREAWAGDSTGD